MFRFLSKCERRVVGNLERAKGSNPRMHLGKLDVPKENQNDSCKTAQIGNKSHQGVTGALLNRRPPSSAASAPALYHPGIGWLTFDGAIWRAAPGPDGFAWPFFDGQSDRSLGGRDPLRAGACTLCALLA